MVSSQSVCGILRHTQLQLSGYFLIFETILCELYNTNNNNHALTTLTVTSVVFLLSSLAHCEVVFTTTVCLNALSCCHVIGWVAICVNKQLHVLSNKVAVACILIWKTVNRTLCLQWPFRLPVGFPLKLVLSWILHVFCPEQKLCSHMSFTQKVKQTLGAASVVTNLLSLPFVAWFPEPLVLSHFGGKMEQARVVLVGFAIFITAEAPEDAGRGKRYSRDKRSQATQLTEESHGTLWTSDGVFLKSSRDAFVRWGLDCIPQLPTLLLLVEQSSKIWQLWCKKSLQHISLTDSFKATKIISVVFKVTYYPNSCQLIIILRILSPSVISPSNEEIPSSTFIVIACFNTQFWKDTETSNQASVLPYDTSGYLPNTQNTVWSHSKPVEGGVWAGMDLMVDPSWPLVTLSAQVVKEPLFLRPNLRSEVTRWWALSPLESQLITHVIWGPQSLTDSECTASYTDA